MRITRVLIGALFLSAGPTFAAVQNSIPLEVKQYSEVGRMTVPDQAQLSIVRINGKIFVLSGMPDRRLSQLTAGQAKDGREILCGKVGGTLRVPVCYYIFFRER